MTSTNKKLDLDKPLQLSDGTPAKLLDSEWRTTYWDGSKLLVKVVEGQGVCLGRIFNQDGSPLYDCADSRRLENVPPPAKYINVYGALGRGYVHESRAEADKSGRAGTRVACVRFVEGQFDE